MKKKERVCFMFGAGAEMCFGLPSGNEYMAKTLLNEEFAKEMKNAYGKNVPSFNGVKPTAHKFGLTKKDAIFLIEEKIEEDKTLNEKINNNPEYNKIYELLKETSKNSNEESKEILYYLKKYFNGDYANCGGKIYKEFFDDFFGEEKIESFSSLYLERSFHTIVDPKKYGKNNFSKIYNYYWSCYYCIVSCLINVIEESKINGVEKYCGDRNKINTYYSNICELSKFLYEEVNLKAFERYSEKNGGNYYSLIRESLKEADEDIELKGILTTNYYKLCELTIPNHSNKTQPDVSYLNGSLDYFEIPENIEVKRYDKLSLEENTLFFPFIFGQSMVKPIVSESQIGSFSKSINILNHSNVLVIIGYGLNNDDNHINSLIHEFTLKEENRLIIVTNDSMDKILNELHIKEDNRITLIQFKNGNTIIPIKKIVSDVFKSILNNR